jgi:hypothetical protein
VRDAEAGSLKSDKAGPAFPDGDTRVPGSYPVFIFPQEILSGMEPAGELRRRSEVGEGPARYVIELRREDFSAVYPGMNRYVVTVTSGDKQVARFVTNNYEYSPRVPLEAERVALELFLEWERRLRENPSVFIAGFPQESSRAVPAPATDLVFIQGSPPGDGNCSILAEWSADAARKAGRTA